jgi:hypothetical protein
VKTYAVPEDTLTHKKLLIEALTRRLFNHTEHGLNIPGHRLADARLAYEEEPDPAKKRVKGAMYAGAMFNRATDIFKRLVELQSEGIEVQPSNELMRECGRCLEAAYSLCRLVLHRSGEESIDELWGEPFRAFSVPLEEFYETRYIKIGQGKRDIDTIADAMVNAFARLPMFPDVGPLIRELAVAAKVKIETLRTDTDIFDVWANFVTAGERLVGYEPVLPASADLADLRVAEIGRKLIANGRDLIFYITRARVSMPKSTQEFVARCSLYAATGNVTALPVTLPA